MTRSGRTARRAPKAAARALALIGVLAASGIAAGASAAAGGQAPDPAAVTTALAYQCRFPSGSRPVEVTVAAGLPGTGRTGRPIQPTGVRLTFALPQAAVADLAKLHSAAVSTTSMLGVDAMNGPSGTSAAWPGTARRAAYIPARGGLVLKTSGRVPSLTPTLPGDVTFTATSLSLTLAPVQANATPSPSPTPNPTSSPTPPPVPSSGPNQGTTPTPSTGGGAATPPTGGAAALRVTCTLAPGQHATLATVPVAGPPVRAASRASAAKSPCFPQPKGGLKLNPKFPLPIPPKGAKRIIATPVPGCAWVVGYSDVRKLKGSALVGPGKTDVNLPVRELVKLPSYFEEDAAAELDFRPCPTCKIVHGLPPAHTTFLGFGFIPVSATLQLTEIGTTNVYAIGTENSLTSNTVFSEVTLRVYGVTVNGVPLDVGPHCQSAHSILLKLSGNPNGNPPYTIQNGGPLTGTITIPPFKGCGVGENLDPLFTASISGPGNFLVLTQGNLCTLQVPPFGCPPTIPTPIRKVSG